MLQRVVSFCSCKTNMRSILCSVHLDDQKIRDVPKTYLVIVFGHNKNLIFGFCLNEHHSNMDLFSSRRISKQDLYGF